MNYTPINLSPRLVRDFFRIANGILDDNAPKDTHPRAGSHAWTPRADLLEDQKSYSVRLDIPGVPKDTIDVSYQDGVLTVAGARNLSELPEGTARIAGERPHGNFRREVRIDAEVNPGGIAAFCQDGVLTITIPKSESAKPVKVAVA